MPDERDAWDWRSPGPIVSTPVDVLDPRTTLACESCGDPDRTVWAWDGVTVVLCPTCDGPDAT